MFEVELYKKFNFNLLQKLLKLNVYVNHSRVALEYYQFKNLQKPRNK